MLPKRLPVNSKTTTNLTCRILNRPSTGHTLLAALVALAPLALASRTLTKAAEADVSEVQMASAGPDRSNDFEMTAGADRYEEGRDPAQSGRVRYLEGSLRIERADEDLRETASVNSPVFSGDSASTPPGGRAEIQLSDGTIVRLDETSRMTFLSIPEAGQTGDNTVLQISQGSVAIETRRRPSRDTDFRIDTPSASIYLLAAGRYRLDVEGKYGKVRVSAYRGVAEVVGDDGSVVLRSGQRSFVSEGSEPESPRSFNTAASDEFEGWIDDRGGRYLRSGDEDVDEVEVPDSVRPYRSELSYYGEWVDVQPYGLVWVPAGVSAGWRPYSNGYWDYGPRGYFWISYDPWGWAPYHYGRWSWASGRGWCWVPGSVFSGAWVSWYYGPSYVGWCPLDFWNDPCSFRFGYSGIDYRCWNFVTYRNVYTRGPRRVYVNPRVVRLEVSSGQGVVARRPVRITPRDVRENRVAPPQIVKQARGLRTSSSVDVRPKANRQPFREQEQEILRRGARPIRPSRPAVSGSRAREPRPRSPGTGSVPGREPRATTPRERPRDEGARTPGRTPEAAPRSRREGRLPVRPRESSRPPRSDASPGGDASSPRQDGSTARPTYIRPRIQGPDDAQPGPQRYRSRPPADEGPPAARQEMPDRSLREFFRESDRPARAREPEDGGPVRERARPSQRSERSEPSQRSERSERSEPSQPSPPHEQARTEGRQAPERRQAPPRSQPKSSESSGRDRGERKPRKK